MVLTSMLKAGAAVVVLGLAGTAAATTFVGSIAVNGASVSTSGSLSELNLLAPAGAIAGLSTGSFAASGSWSGSLMTMSASALQGSGPVNLTLSAAGFGTFTATSYTVLQQTASSLDVIVLGSFNPQFGAGTFSSNEAATMRLGVSRTGTTASMTGTLALATATTGSGTAPGTGGGSTGGGSTSNPGPIVVPVVGIPEPASMALLGGGLLGLGLVRRRRTR